MKKLTIFLGVIFALAPLAFANAQELPPSVITAVVQIKTFTQAPFDETNRVKQGSGFFADHEGCVYTNAHVVLDDANEFVPEHVRVHLTSDRGKPADFLYEGEVVYFDEAVDLAYVCPKESVNLFTNFFPRTTEPMFAKRHFGEDLWLLGFTAAGDETITVSSGEIVGFLDGPDFSDGTGFPDILWEELKVYKADALAGSGVSGGVAINEQREVIGIPFAGNNTPGGFSFVLSEDMYLQFENDLRAELAKSGSTPGDCIFDISSQYYSRGGQFFYDDQCEFIFDQILETELTHVYQTLCGEPIPSTRLVPAIRYAKRNNGDLTKWTELTLTQCAGRAQKEIEEPTAPAGEFAYGKQRLSSLAIEQNLARELKTEIDAEFPNLKIHEGDWSTVVNSYVYGGYPVEAIQRAIEVGGYTVHPEIPFEIWQTSADYQTFM